MKRLMRKPRSAAGKKAGSLARLFAERWLLIEADGFGARAAIAEREAGAWRLGTLVRSRHWQPAAQLSELTAALHAAGEKLPKRVLLVSSACVPALIDLPVDPQRPRPDTQMREMVHYDLEPLVAQHNNLWTLGEVMGAIGVLDAQARREVAVALEQRRMNERHQPYRFGEVAIAEGMATREQVDACLERQHAQQILDADLACGWRPVVVPEGVAHAGPRWLGAACAPGLRDAWRDALAATGLRLTAVAPRLLLGGLPTDAQTDSRARLLLEIRPEQVARGRRHGLRLDALDSEPRLERAADAAWLADQILEWTLDDPEETLLLVADPALDAEACALLAEELQARTRVPCRVLAADADTTCLAGFAAWLADRDRDRDARAVPEIAARVPLPPPWKRRGGRQAMIYAGFVLALIAWEGHARWRLAAMENEMGRFQHELRIRADDGNAQEDARARELEQHLDKARETLAAALVEADRLEGIARRVATVPGLIRLLADSIDPQIVLDALRETDSNSADIGIQVVAWSTSDVLAQRFAKTVQEAVRPLRLSVAQTDVKREPGRTGAMGYTVTFWLIPLEPETGLSQVGSERMAPESEARQ